MSRSLRLGAVAVALLLEGCLAPKVRTPPPPPPPTGGGDWEAAMRRRELEARQQAEAQRQAVQAREREAKAQALLARAQVQRLLDAGAAGRQAEVAWALPRAERVPPTRERELPEPWDPPVPPGARLEAQVRGSAGAKALAEAERAFAGADDPERGAWGLEVARLRFQLGDHEGARALAEQLLSEDRLPPEQDLEAILLVVEVDLQAGRLGEGARTLRTAEVVAQRPEAGPEAPVKVAWAQARWHLEAGEPGEALAHVEAAQEAARPLTGPKADRWAGQVAALKGRLLMDLGDPEGARQALAEAQRRLPAEALEAHLGVAALLGFLELGQPKAEATFRRLARRAHAQGLPLLEVSLQANAVASALEGRSPRSLPPDLRATFQLAQALGEGEAPSRVAVTWAGLDLARGRAAQGVARLLWVRGRAQHPLTRAAAEHGLMVGFAALGRRDLAILAGKRAVATLQEVQRRARLLGPGAERFRAANARTFRLLADLLIRDGGRLAEAQEVLDLLKADEFGRFLRAGGDPTEAIQTTGAEDRAQAHLEEAEGAWVAQAAELDSLRRIPAADLKPEALARRKDLEVKLKAARAAFRAALLALRTEAEAQEPAAAAKVAARQLERLSGVQGRLGKGTVLLSYVLAPERLHILLTTPLLQVHREVPVGAEALAQAIQSLRWALKDLSRDPRPEARALHAYLLAPVAKDLEAAGAQRLLLDLDGPLRYLPFATLHDGHQWLVERYALAVTARGAFAASDDSGTPGKEARAFGVSRAHGGFAPLAAVPGELSGVLDQVKGAGFAGEAFLDEAFTAERLKELTEATAVVHVASHFQFGPGSEDRSALLVGDGSLLSLAAIRAEGVRFDGVRMLTLSACQTGVGGGKDAQGVEVEGLGALALDMGARSVVATLWKVADASTADLMKAFYGRWSTGGPRAESLRDAQLRLIRKEGTARDWSHPFYWGPFILMGAWR